MTLAKVQDGAANTAANAQNLATACALCSHNCGIRVDVKHNKIVAVRADESHPATLGYTCNKAYAIAQLNEHKQRVKYPLKKQPDGTFARISWEQAITEIAAKLNHIRTEYAPRAIAIAGFGGQGNHSGGLAAMPFMLGIGSPMAFTAIGQEKTQHWLNDRRMMRGTNDMWLMADKHHAKFLLLLGSNPHFSNTGFNNPKDALKELARDPERHFVVVDPRRTETSRLANRHLAIKPARDVYLLLALAGVIVQENWVDERYVSEKAKDFEALRALYQRIDVANMAQWAGLSEADVRDTARELATIKPASISFDLGVKHTPNSTLISYLIRVLLVMTGNLGRIGGNIYVQQLGPKMPFIKQPAQALHSGMTAIPAMLPLPQFSPAILPEEITTNHPHRIRALICDTANPISSYPDTKRFREAFAQLDLLVVIDPAMSETAYLADYVLPTPTSYEKWEVAVFPKSVLVPQVRPPVVKGPDEALPEVEIYYRLARAMGVVPAAPAILHKLAKKAMHSPTRMAAYLAALNSVAAMGVAGGVKQVIARSVFMTYETLGAALPNPMLAYIWLLVLGYATTRRDQVVRALPELASVRHPIKLAQILLQKIIDHPEGVVLGHYEMKRNLEYYNQFKDGKVRVWFDDYAADIQALMTNPPDAQSAEYPFVLNGGMRTGFTANTIMQDPSWRKGRGPHTALYISTADAEALSLKNGDQVKISSRRSSVVVPIHIDPATRQGHLQLPNMLAQRYPDENTGEMKQIGIAINELVDINDRDVYTAVPHTKRIQVRLDRVLKAG